MQIKRLIHIFLGMILSFVFLLSCSKSNNTFKTDLFSHFSQFPVLPETQVIDFSDSSSRIHYLEGWFPVATTDESQFARTVGNKASLKFFFHNQENLTLSARFRCNQSIQIKSQWNGIALLSQQIDQGKSEIKWDLNSKLIQPGINILEFRFSPVIQDAGRKPRIDILNMAFSSLKIDPKPELTMVAPSQSIRIQGPLSLLFFLRTYKESRLNFTYRSQSIQKDEGVLKISIVPLNKDIKEKNIKLTVEESPKWKQESINLSEYDNQLIKIEIQHLAGYSTLTEINQPVLTGRTLPLSKKKVMLLGVDGAAWEVINSQIDQGKLPHFKQLIESGSSGRLRSVLPMYSPLIWTSIVTGKIKEKHGIAGFLEQREHEDEIIPNSRLNRKCLALWNILSDEGKVVGVISPWVTWPAEKVNGFLLTDRIYFEKLPDTTFPGELMNLCKDLNASLLTKPDEPLITDLLALLSPDLMNMRSPVQKNIDQGRQYLKQDYLKNKVGYILHSFFDPEFYYIYLRAPDVTSHFFWKYYQPDDTVLIEEIERYSTIIPSVYSYVDTLIGQQLELASEDSTIIVVSDHGMGPKSYTTDIIFDNIDKLWQQIGIRKIINNTEQNRFQLNLSFQTHQAAGKAEASLLKLVTGPRKQPLFKLQEGEKPNTLILELNNIHNPDGNAEIFFNNKLIGKLEDFVTLREISGDHTLYGILIMKGPDIKAGHRLQDYSVLDIAPTILVLLGLPVPKDMDGHIITEAFLPSYTEKNPFRFIETYEGLNSKPFTDDKKQKMDKESEQEILERLRSLGYIK